jgi:hypothetical protein
MTASRSQRSILVNNADARMFNLNLHHEHLVFRWIKIVALIGTASPSHQKRCRLIAKKLDVVRINVSHGKIEDHLRTIRLMRSI